MEMTPTGEEYEQVHQNEMTLDHSERHRVRRRTTGKTTTSSSFYYRSPTISCQSFILQFTSTGERQVHEITPQQKYSNIRSFRAERVIAFLLSPTDD